MRFEMEKVGRGGDVQRLHKDASLGYECTLELEDGMMERVTDIEFADRFEPVPVCPNWKVSGCCFLEPAPESLILTTKFNHYLLCTDCWELFPGSTTTETTESGWSN